MAFTAAHRRSSPGSLSSTWYGIICRHCNRSRPPLSHSSRDRGTSQDRSNRGGWRGRSRPSSGRGTARQQQQLTQRERSANVWANIATTDQRGGTPFVADVETFSRGRSSSNNIPNLSSEQWSKLLTFINNTDVTQSDKLSASRAAHHDRPSTHSPTVSIPFDSEAQRAHPSTHGPADSLPANSTTQRLHPSDRTSVSVLPTPDHTTGPVADPSNPGSFLDQNISTAPHPVAPNPVTFIPAAPFPSPSQSTEILGTRKSTRIKKVPARL
ncbi:hypothetical protein M9H77_24175 [Catharanthus roseus]|uniref:Uncharacterized protein n=1 Tax=Catharanthus roseus TaxID=4058 RepID=A0ACC0AWM0_CATRO|nr:hypothetical protein M9H77_24175 [Catharanthus roseus]